MSDHWLYSRQLPAGPADWTLEGDEAQHARAKHLEPDEAIHLFDGRGRVATARVVECGKRALSVRIQALGTTPPRQPRVTVAVSPPKGERLDWLLEKLTELGVACIWPVQADRSVVTPRDDRMERWHRRLLEAAKQAHVAWLPELAGSQKLPQVLARAGEFTVRLVADTAGDVTPILRTKCTSADRVLVLIGPEGGFSQAERDAMRQAGLVSVSLGPTVLRTETAAVVAAGCLLAAGEVAP